MTKRSVLIRRCGRIERSRSQQYVVTNPDLAATLGLHRCVELARQGELDTSIQDQGHAHVRRVAASDGFLYQDA